MRTEGGQYATTEGEHSHTSEGGHRHEIIWKPKRPQIPQNDTLHPPTTYKTENPNARYHEGFNSIKSLISFTAYKNVSYINLI